MTIQFHCPACDQMLRVPDSAAGKQARCPQCKTQMAVPAFGAAGFAPIQSVPHVEPIPAAPSPPALSSDLEKQLDFLRQGMTPRSTSAEPAAANPFGDVAPAAPRKESIASSDVPELNPYASPAPTGQSYAPYGELGRTRGLPWEATGQNVGTWIETTKSIITEPVSAFHDMWPEGGFVLPLAFWFIGILITAVAAVAWEVAKEVAPALNNQAINFGEITLLGVFGLVVLLVYAVTMLLVQSTLLHLLLWMVGGANRSFGTTFRVVAYVNGAISWLYVVPCFGNCILLILLLVTTSNGLASAHQTSNGKAIAAVIMQMVFVLLVALGIAGAVGFIAVGLDKDWFG